MHASTSPFSLRADSPAVAPTDSERIAALEGQVAELSAALPALQLAFAAGRACERGDTVPRRAARPRPRHLRLAAVGES